MKKILLSENFKNIGYIIGYWLIFFIIPVLFMFYLNSISMGHINILAQMIWYFVFIFPLLFFIPYLLAKPKSGFLFITLGLVVPIAIIIVIFLYELAHMPLSVG
jgi:hypothetical protein